MSELESGDFLYQSDQELFMVVTDEDEKSYKFAVHGWREIGKDRIDEYLSDGRSKIHSEDDVYSLIDKEADEDTIKQFERLAQLFAVYEEAQLPEEGPHEDFKFEEQ